MKHITLAGHITLFAMLSLVLCSCNHKTASSSSYTIPCAGDQVIKLTYPLTEPNPIVLCPGEKVTWHLLNHQLVITFNKNGDPFNGTAIAGNGDAPTGVGASPVAGYTERYDYSVSVDGGTPFDPHIIVLGGGSKQP
jgi:hypothetical protein